MRKIFMMLISLSLLTLTINLTNARPADDTGVNEEGFIQKWLILAPISLPDNTNVTDALDEQQIKDEAKLKPKADEKIKVGMKDLEWKAKATKDHLVDLDALIGQNEDSISYSVCYLVADEEMKDVKLKVGSNDQVKVYVNGKEALKNAEGRTTEKDQDQAKVTLNKGTNVIVVKVINEKNSWSFCVRFTDKDDKPITKLKAQTKE